MGGMGNPYGGAGGVRSGGGMGMGMGFADGGMGGIGGISGTGIGMGGNSGGSMGGRGQIGVSGMARQGSSTNTSSVMGGASDLDLKRKIAMLEAENKNLKEGGSQGGRGAQAQNNDGNWYQSMGNAANRAAL
jgi:hypothetical protein